MTGPPLGDAGTRAVIPALVQLVRSGRLPVGRPISHYPFDDIDRAAQDMVAGKAIEPVITF
ncbi:hypothetical protein [Nonomuraea sp. NPDC005650]|uniref:hypothetical protein n=1 Tax=Nonomuraea sp. NPDC005650 TaxID=3157045 RepID=UPI0033BE35CF